MIDVRVGDIWQYCDNNTYVVIGKNERTVDLFDLENLQYHYFYSTRDFGNKFFNGGEMWKRLYQYKPD